MRAKIRWISAEKGYGFVDLEDGSIAYADRHALEAISNVQDALVKVERNGDRQRVVGVRAPEPSLFNEDLREVAGSTPAIAAVNTDLERGAAREAGAPSV